MFTHNNSFYWHCGNLEPLPKANSHLDIHLYPPHPVQLFTTCILYLWFSSSPVVVNWWIPKMKDPKNGPYMRVFPGDYFLCLSFIFYVYLLKIFFITFSRIICWHLRWFTISMLFLILIWFLVLMPLACVMHSCENLNEVLSLIPSLALVFLCRVWNSLSVSPHGFRQVDPAALGQMTTANTEKTESGMNFLCQQTIKAYGLVPLCKHV